MLVNRVHSALANSGSSIMRISSIYKLLTFPILLLPISAHADETALLIVSPGLVLQAPAAKESELVGRTVWAGDAFGAGETGTLRPGPSIIPGRLGLAYTKPAEFVSVLPRSKIDSGVIHDMVAKHVESLGAPDIEYVQFEEVAYVDLNADGRRDTVVLAFTERESSEQPGDITAVFLVETISGQPQVMAQIVIVAAAGGLPRGHHHLTPVAMARNPDSGAWNLLVVERFDQWWEKTFTKEVTVRGQMILEKKSRRGMDLLINAAVYELKGQELKVVDGLQHSYGIAGDT